MRSAANATLEAMRIVTWNMNGKDRTRSHQDAWGFLLETLQPDIVLLQEVRISEEIKKRIAGEYSHLFTPRLPNLTWGSAILSRAGELTLEWENSSRGAALGASSSVPGIGPSPSLACKLRHRAA
jgi:exonuclease III